jgi:hypothetical protein
MTTAQRFRQSSADEAPGVRQPGAAIPMRDLDAAPRTSANDNAAAVRRKADGSIDVDYYRARAHAFRREAVGAFWRWFRRRSSKIFRKSPH